MDEERSRTKPVTNRPARATPFTKNTHDLLFFDRDGTESRIDKTIP